jgi:hypothetical protein
MGRSAEMVCLRPEAGLVTPYDYFATVTNSGWLL